MKKFLSIGVALFLYSCGTGKSSGHVESLSPTAFAEELNSDREIVLLDVRSPEEVEGGFIERAENLNYNDESFSSALDDLDRSKKYFVYCASGKRSGKAWELMKEKGFEDVVTLEGGFNAWKEKGLAVVKN